MQHFKRNILIGFALFAASFFFDKELLYFITSFRTPALTLFFQGISYLSETVTIILFGIFLFLFTKKFQTLRAYLLAFALSVSMITLLKYSMGRSRPPIEHLLQADTPSFPSGHANAAFTALPFIIKNFPHFQGIWITFASLALLGRVYLGVHYPSDVLGGALIGYALSSLIYQKYALKANSSLKKAA